MAAAEPARRATELPKRFDKVVALGGVKGAAALEAVIRGVANGKAIPEILNRILQ